MPQAEWLISRCALEREYRSMCKTAAKAPLLAAQPPEAVPDHGLEAGEADAPLPTHGPDSAAGTGEIVPVDTGMADVMGLC